MRPSEQLDSSIEIVTPENISFRYEVAGPFRRLPAFVIDFAIRLGVWLMGMFALAISGLLGGSAGFGILLILWFLLEWFYGGIFETYWNGQTPGKRVVNIRVLSTDGRPINGLQAVMRNILRFADMMPLLPMSALIGDAAPMALPTGLVGLVTPMCNRRFQRLGDLVCNTMVVVEDRSWLFGVAKVEDPRAAQLAEYIPANFPIPRQLSRAVATYVERRRFFSAARRREIARHLAQPLLERFHLPADTSYDLMLCALYYRAFIADQGRAQADVLQTLPVRGQAGMVGALGGARSAPAADGTTAPAADGTTAPAADGTTAPAATDSTAPAAAPLDDGHTMAADESASSPPIVTADRHTNS